MAFTLRTRLGRAVAVIAALSVVCEALATTLADQPPKDGAARALAIIVNRSNPVENLTRDDLRRIFMLVTQTWPHGRKITLVLGEKGEPLRAEAIQLVCGIPEGEFERHLLLQTLRGVVGLGPRTIRSTNAMIRFVFNAPGAIGYAPADQIDSSVKVLRIDGVLPGDPRYPLRLAPRRVQAAP